MTLSLTFATLAAALAAAPAPSSAAPAEPAAAAPREAPRLLGYDVRLRASAGFFDGVGVLADSGPVAELEADLTPELRRGRLRLTLPLRFDRVERLRASLDETALGAAAEPEVRLTRALRAGAEAGLTWMDRPGWPDVYQRDAGGALAPTDRYGYLAWRVGVNAWLRAGAGQHLRARYRWVSYDYAGDPGFDPLDPGHLTPRDHGEHQVDLSWRLVREAWSAGARLDWTYRLDDVAPARAAGSGAIVDGKLQRLSTAEPSVEVELPRLGGRVALALSYGLGIQSDRYAGYYSYEEHHPRLRATVPLSERLEAALELDGRFRRYGADSTGATRLEWGDRRQSTRLGVGGGLRYALAHGLAVRADAEWIDRSTNFPDYVPNGVAPDYDIDWDYRNVQVTAGLEWRASREAGRRR